MKENIKMGHGGAGETRRPKAFQRSKDTESMPAADTMWASKRRRSRESTGTANNKKRGKEEVNSGSESACTGVAQEKRHSGK